MPVTHTTFVTMLAALAAAPAATAQQVTDKIDVGQVFARNCAKCHQPPDPAFAVDRAWITQLADTA